MSNFPPGGPPYDPNHPLPPGMAYAPTPVMMPMPHPPHRHHHPRPPRPVYGQPTYITNIYRPTPFVPPEPVQVVNHPPVIVAEPETLLIDWVPATPQTAQSLAPRAFVAGREAWDQSPLWVIRSHHSGEFIPGKLAIKSRAAYIPHAGREVPVHNFEVLCAPASALRWLSSRDGQVPVGAFLAGNTHNGEPLYICRVNHRSAFTPGKVHPSHRCAYISFAGEELSFKQYEVLCKIVG